MECFWVKSMSELDRDPDIKIKSTWAPNHSDPYETIIDMTTGDEMFAYQIEELQGQLLHGASRGRYFYFTDDSGESKSILKKFTNFF